MVDDFVNSIYNPTKTCQDTARTRHFNVFTQLAISGPLETQRRKGCSMSLVLLNSEGVVAKKLAFVSLPPDYVVPDGMIISWKQEMTIIHATIFWDPSGPPLAYFYLKTAHGEISHTSSYGDTENISVVVQGKKAADVNLLRDKILQMIHHHRPWDVHNDFDSFLSKLARRF